MTLTPSVRQAIDALFESHTRAGTPGCAVAVIRDGETIYERGYGLANVELDVPITPKSVFNIGSMAKQFTAFAVALLADEGKLSLDDDVRTHLPDMPDYGMPVTLRHLIHHTGGVRNSFPALLALAEWRDTDATTTDDVLNLLNAQRNLNFTPGAEFEYTNSGYVLLAKVCEAVSGRSFREFCQQRIFTPLGMDDSYVNDSYFGLMPGRALGYYPDGELWFNAPLTDAVVGPTNIYTSVQDLAKWDANFYSGGVGGDAVITQMHQPGTLNDGTVLDYASGMEIGPSHQHRGWQVVEHGGSQGGYASHMLRIPEQRFSVILLCNYFTWSARDMAFKVADLFVEERAVESVDSGPESSGDHPTVTLTEAQLASKAGIYFNDKRAALRTIAIKDDKLQFEGFDLVPLDEHHFYFDVEHDTQVVFTPDREGNATTVTTVTSSGEYNYTEVDAVTLASDDLSAYAGCYFSPELDVYWRISAGEDGLVVRRRKYVDSQMTPLFKDTFRDDWGALMGYPTTYLVRFLRDAAGDIYGLSVSGTGVRNMKFVRINPTNDNRYNLC